MIPLTRAELDCARLAILEALPAKAVAHRRGCRLATAKNHLIRAYAKAGVNTAMELGVALGWIREPSTLEDEVAALRRQVDELAARVGRTAG